MDLGILCCKIQARSSVDFKLFRLQNLPAIRLLRDYVRAADPNAHVWRYTGRSGDSCAGTREIDIGSKDVHILDDKYK
jgi:hypothetical protein